MLCCCSFVQWGFSDLLFLQQRISRTCEGTEKLKWNTDFLQIFHGEEQGKFFKATKTGGCDGYCKHRRNIQFVFKFQCLLSGRNRLNRAIDTILMNWDSLFASGLSSPLLSHTLHCTWGWQLGLYPCLSFLWSVACVLAEMPELWGKKMTIKLLWRDTDNCGFENYFSDHVPNA